MPTKISEGVYFETDKSRDKEKEAKKGKCVHCEDEVKAWHCRDCSSEISAQCPQCHAETTHKNLRADRFMKNKPNEFRK